MALVDHKERYRKGENITLAVTLTPPAHARARVLAQDDSFDFMRPLFLAPTHSHTHPLFHIYVLTGSHHTAHCERRQKYHALERGPSFIDPNNEFVH